MFFTDHVQASIDSAVEGKSGPAAQTAAQNALAPWLGLQPKFRDPSAGHF